MLPEESQQRQQWQAQHRGMLSLDPDEQMRATALEATGDPFGQDAHAILEWI